MQTYVIGGTTHLAFAKTKINNTKLYWYSGACATRSDAITKVLTFITKELDNFKALQAI